jgi:L-ascorbate metabolism protein UlaG (beta-lactamase superfamily)
MQISYLGHSCFKIEVKAGGENVTILIDPYDDSVGLPMPKTKADIALVTHDHFDHDNLAAVKGEPFIIKGAGEYEFKKVFVYGVPTYHDEAKGAERGPNTCFRIDAEDLALVHLGDLGHILDEEQLELLEEADILLIPVGGKYTLDAKKAAEVVSQIEPRIVIPMHYKVPGLKVDLDPVDGFLKEMGAKKAESIDKLKITKKDLMTEDTQVVLLQKV